MNKHSPEDVALAYIRNIKEKLSPIEEVEDISTEIDNFKEKQSKNNRKRTFKFKNRRKKNKFIPKK